VTYGVGVLIGVGPSGFEVAPSGFVNGETAGVAIAVLDGAGGAVPGVQAQAQGGVAVVAGTDA
jgi:hypothetical protein